MCSDSEKNMSAFADQNHAPSLTCVRLERKAAASFSASQLTLLQYLSDWWDFPQCEDRQKVQQ